LACVLAHPEFLQEKSSLRANRKSSARVISSEVEYEDEYIEHL